MSLAAAGTARHSIRPAREQLTQFGAQKIRLAPGGAILPAAPARTLPMLALEVVTLPQAPA